MAIIASANTRLVTINGTSFFADTSNAAKWWRLAENGQWELATFQTIDLFVDAGSTYIDVGAWIGGTVLYAASKAARVIAFEPDPIALINLKKNLAANPLLAQKIYLIEGGLGKYDGEAPLFNNSPGDSCSSLFSRFAKNNNPAQQKKITDIKLIDSHRFLNSLDLSEVSLIKIDIEGGEYDLIPHIADVLVDHTPSLHLSFHPFNICQSSSEAINASEQLSKSRMLLECLSCYEYWYLERDGALVAENGRQNILDQIREKIPIKGPVVFTNRNIMDLHI